MKSISVLDELDNRKSNRKKLEDLYRIVSCHRQPREFPGRECQKSTLSCETRIRTLFFTPDAQAIKNRPTPTPLSNTTILPLEKSPDALSRNPIPCETITAYSKHAPSVSEFSTLASFLVPSLPSLSRRGINNVSPHGDSIIFVSFQTPFLPKQCLNSVLEIRLSKRRIAGEVSEDSV
ncbi:hypothetical protein CEXT_398271 [Caerostris extrusa]|uniref:Uncharacterized protein n=1 Tax=Caerostris extrusa TaxID=172846 RepID=A0AAV4NIB8_CAEEX|nr:hypothetical protein CEXT_398271 [Caerostris extrusa]